MRLCDDPQGRGAVVACVEAGSTAALAGLESGMRVLSVEGGPLRDVLDWYWLSDGFEVELEVMACPDDAGRPRHTGISASDDSPGKRGAPERAGLPSREGHAEEPASEPANQPAQSPFREPASEPVSGSPVQSAPEPSPAQAPRPVILRREPGEGWGLTFTEAIFDGLRCCVNDCCFCFMRMLPEGMRPSLRLRDDDYRLSFLQGNFVTLTNTTDEDIERIVEMHLSPLNVSLHAVDPGMRRQMMGRNEARGIEALERLLAAGIECKVQIVLMPGVNDGPVLEETLDWVAERPGIIATGIVPYGYTRYARVQQGYDTPESAREVIRQLRQRGPRVQLADEFYVRAWPGEVLTHLPPSACYAGYPMLEDGIGMVRRFVDAQEGGSSFIPQILGGELGSKAVIATGEAFASVLSELWPECSERILPVRNEFFGGNVDAAGLLTAGDIIRQAASVEAQRLVLPPAMFNDGGLTLDDKTADDIMVALGIPAEVLDLA